MNEAEIAKLYKWLQETIRDVEVCHVEELVNQGIPIEKSSSSDCGLLNLAVGNGRKDLVEMLVRRGANINVVDKCGTPLTLAISKRHYPIAKYLIAVGANVCKKGTDHCTPLALAIRIKSWEMIELLLNKGAKYTIHSGFYEALIQGDLNIVRFLIQKGADVNGYFGEIPLNTAVITGRLEIVKELVAEGADVNKSSEDGIHALTLSFLKAIPEMALFLLENGANVNVKDRNGDPMIVNFIKMNDVGIIKEALKQKVDVTVKDQKGNSPVMIAVENRNVEVLQLLIKKGAKLNIKDEEGNKLFYKALVLEDLEMVKFLVGLGANVNGTDTHGNTPLLIAAKQSNFEIFEFLIKSGAKIHNSLEKIKQATRANEDFYMYLHTEVSFTVGVKF